MMAKGIFEKVASYYDFVSEQSNPSKSENSLSLEEVNVIEEESGSNRRD